MRLNQGFNEFKQRFYDFSDSVIHAISITWTEVEGGTFHIKFSCRDSTQGNGDEWVCVTFRIMSVDEFCVREKSDYSIQVLSQELHILEFDDSIGIDFSDSVTPPSSIDFLRGSEAFALGKELHVDIEPYFPENEIS